MDNTQQEFIKRYNEFIHSLELIDIYVAELTFKRLENIPEDKQIPVKVIVKPTKNEYKKAGTDLYEITHRVLFRLEYVEEEQEKLFFELKVTFKLFYRSKRELNDEIFKIFVERNIPINVFPFLREIVCNSMYRAGLPPILIPLMKPHSDLKKEK
jgi:preprotein translocase subunit SecB